MPTDIQVALAKQRGEVYQDPKKQNTWGVESVLIPLDPTCDHPNHILVLADGVERQDKIRRGRVLRSKGRWPHRGPEGRLEEGVERTFHRSKPEMLISIW